MTGDLPSVPSKEPVADFLRFAADTLAITDMSENGARVLVRMSEQLRALTDGLVPTSERDQVLHQAAEVARASIEDDFALLRNNALMGAWGALEACVDDIAINWLAETSGACADVAISTLKVLLGDYLALSDDARWPWLLDQIKRAKASTLKAGVGQFESLLGAVSLGGEVDPDLRRALLYTKAMRNVIAHKGGRVDAKFVADCPGFMVAEGARLSITGSQFMAAISAMVVYVEVVHERSRTAAGRTPEPLSLPPWVKDLESLPKVFERDAVSGEAHRERGAER